MKKYFKIVGVLCVIDAVIGLIFYIGFCIVTKPHFLIFLLGFITIILFAPAFGLALIALSEIIKDKEKEDQAEVALPDGVKEIGSGAFEDRIKLNNITIPDSVTSIGESAFYNCNSLKSIKIPKGVTIIEKYVFKECRSLESITIPDGVTSIGRYAFGNCVSLNSVIISKNVTNISGYAFHGCKSLTTVYYKGSKEQWDNINIDSGNDFLIHANIIYNYED